MRISAKADYAVRAAVELAAADDGPTKGDAIAAAQGIPLKFLENILADLRHAGLVRSQRGADGGYWLARPAQEITDRRRHPRRRGPAGLRARRPARGRQLRGQRRARCADVWIAVRASLRDVVEHVTLADLAAGRLPARVAKLTRGPGAWDAH